MSCKAKYCKLLNEFWMNFNITGNPTNRDYYIWTELFCIVHNGKDYCEELEKGVKNNGIC